MPHLTQTRSDNCWQTCVAMLLGRAVDELPAQYEYAVRDQYAEALRIFLDKHYGLTYVELPIEKCSTDMVRGARHLVIGETVRTTTENDAWHAVVGTGGNVFWDVHPSRAGLTKAQAWGLLVPTPPAWRLTWANKTCACSKCAGQTL